MVKILKEKYPMGSFPYQKDAGRYIHNILYDNLKIPAKKIIDDMTFLNICSSSTLEVGTGKSTFMTQIGEAYTDLVNQYHNLNLTFTMKNVVFRPQDLIKRAFELPKYSCIILDEWEETHYWSELAMALRQWFQKCRQLNLFIIIIIPNFFQLPMHFAISKSAIFIDVKFGEGFERGHFAFYDFVKKRELYVLGKKTQNYKVVKPDFEGDFTNGYGVNEEEYRKEKYRDMIDAEERVKPEVTARNTKINLFNQVYERLKGKITVEELSNAFKVDKRTGFTWLKAKREGKEGMSSEI